MKKSLKNILVFLVSLTCVLFLSSDAKAVEYTFPYFNFIGDFNYNSATDQLVLSNFDITLVTNLDGSSSGDDDISGNDVYWNFISGGLFNNSGNNLNFGGPTRFEIKDGSGYIFLTAALSNFQLTQSCTTLPFPPYTTSCQDPSLNTNYTLNSLWSLEVDPNYDTSSSQYIRELGSVLNRNDGVIYNTDINFDFIFTSGDNKFINNGSGQFSGKLVVMPEPVSSLLFISGGAVFAFRRFNKRTGRFCHGKKF